MLRKFGSGVLILAAAAACGDSTGPEDFDPVETQQKAELVLAAFENPAFVSLAALQNLSFGGPLLSATVPMAPSELTTPALGSRLRAFLGALPSFGTASSLAIFPADLLGATFVWNQGQGGYAEDPNATGAPSNGVRVLLYTVNPITRQPVMPLDPRGYLDITDESTAAVDALHLVAVWEDVTHLDYVASATTSAAAESVTLSADGYVSNGSDQVDFALSFTGTESSATVDYQITHDEATISLTGSISAAGGDVTLSVSDGENTVALDVSVTLSTVSGTIEYNGDVAVEIGGTPDAPTFTRPDGTPLTENEIAALQALGDLIDVIFTHFDDLLAPALLAFLLG